MVTQDEVEQFLALAHEIRAFEVKGPGELGAKAFCSKVARAAMAMGNLRDGGLVCIGIDESQMAAMRPGLTQSQLDQWSDYDNVHDALGRYCDPPVSFALHAFQLTSGASVVVLEVHEFEDVPHLCRKDYPGVLQCGVVYVRPRGKPQSVPVPSSTEMRELLDLATTKGVREFVRRAGDAGIVLGGARAAKAVDLEAFGNEAAEAWSASSDVMTFIASAGHFDVAVRPGPFEADRVSPSRLESLVAENTVRMRGWPVPYIDNRLAIERHGTWIGQDIEARVVPHSEAWRMCASGQFLHRRVLATDLSRDGQLGSDAPGVTGAVAVWDVLLYLVEVAEFSARLGAALECHSITIDVSLNGTAGRRLISGDWNRELHDDYIVSANRLDAMASAVTPHLMQNTLETGIRLTQLIISQFGLEIPDQILKDWQDEVFNRG